MKISLGQMEFVTQKSAKEEIQKRLHAAETETPLDDFEFWMNLLERHPSASDKIGCGVVSFKVTLNRYRQRCLYAIRWDGTPVDFSFLKCLRPSTPKELFAKALRHAVEDQIIAFREAVFSGQETTICPILGKAVTRSQVNVDHEPPWRFETLVQKFSIDEKVDPKTAVAPSVDGELGRRLSDPALEARFREFHKTHAKLRVISEEAHRNINR
jgi:hypothetical protein